MKKIILFLVVLPLFSLAQNKSSSDSLSSWQMDSLQLNAVQKLRSFYNCLCVLSNPQNHQELRDMASKRAKLIFSRQDCSVDGKMITAFVDSCSTLTKSSNWKVDDVKIKGDMKRNTDVLGDDNYEGSLMFTLTSSAGNSSKKAYITLEKNKKKPGTDQKDSWTVFICDIR